ncbi:telomeric repeat-binding factor 2-like isoform X2 [Pseudoliparis swirei]|uniref:telomeric repeat-binding factor 2-like isoform X2 n=1 Tax=Pseudoliparis swirei TaxID=2059687 RepID=UPI0024BE4AEA|nr:telomeric repeat-binding factor 2-like isoform X2 [Pseudoliparis swirei]
MAAKEAVDGYNAEVEATVNRWIVDYYSFLAFELFKNGKYAEFCDVRDLIHSVLARPVEPSDVFKTNIRILQFLSRINDGENLEVSFEPDKSLSPLESALMVLEDIIQEGRLSMPQQDFEKVCTSLKETIVTMFIKKNKFHKAKQVLDKHFTKTISGKKVVFLGLIKKKSNVHKVIEQMDFQRFKVEMLAFCQTLYTATVPFLHRAATDLIGRRLAAQDADGPDEQDEATPPCPQQTITIQFLPRTHIVIQRTRLEAAHRALAAAAGERTFAQLEEEVEEEDQARKENLSRRLSPAPADSEEAGPFQRDLGSPMEADQPPRMNAVSQTESSCLSETPPGPRNRRPDTVARLVVEPDSQGSSQSTAASQEREADVGAEEPPQPPAVLDEKDSQSLGADNEISIPVRKIRRRAKKSSRASSSLADSEEDPHGSVDPHGSEDPHGSVANGDIPVGKHHNRLLGRVPEAVVITDSTFDSSPERSAPQTSSTPNKDPARVEGPSHTKWKVLVNTAKESKVTWSDDESNVGAEKNNELANESVSGHRKRMWSARETKNLKQGVNKFGEGAWTKIKSYYAFNDRTNVNLKDRWRTMKKLNMI